MSIRQFFTFTKYGWIYLLCTPVVVIPASIIFHNVITPQVFPSNPHLSAISTSTVAITLSAFGLSKAFRTFLSYKKRKDAYERVRLFFLTGGYRPNVYHALGTTRCEASVIKELDKEFKKP